MRKLKDLAPPLELCRKIPVGKFEDSALVFIFWHKSPNTPVEIRTRCELENDPEFDDLVEEQRIIIYPAPTLEEIMAALPTIVQERGLQYYLLMTDARNYAGCFSVGYGRLEGKFLIPSKFISKSSNLTIAAMELWFKVEDQSCRE